jgi:hypothetical protein
MKRLFFRITALSAVATVALVLGFARAQLVTPSTGRIPHEAPHGWKQADWNIMLARCYEVFADLKARQFMTAQELKNAQFSTLESEDVETCLHMAQGGVPQLGAQGASCSNEADCAPGFSCFRSGAPWNIHYCMDARPQAFHEYDPPGRPVKTCNTPSDCGPGDWHCSGGTCGYTGEKRCSTNADCHGGWVCVAEGNGHACMPPQP